MTSRTLFTALVDDAGPFPPASLDLPDAVARHRADAVHGDPILTHRFLCRASSLTDLARLVRDGEPIRVGVIGDVEAPRLETALRTAASEGRIAVDTVDLPPGDYTAGRVADAVARFAPAEVYIEATTAGVDRLAAAIADAPVGVKVRCGGLRAEAFPSSTELAHAVVGCARHGLRMRATAGLHHAVRHRDPATGFVHHGFWNLLVACAHAAAGAPVADVAGVLAVKSAARLAELTDALTVEQASGARRLFVRYGSCDTGTPPAEIHRLIGTAADR